MSDMKLFVSCIILLLILFCNSVIFAVNESWKTLSEGFEISWFDSADSTVGDSMITVVRVDPDLFGLTFCSVSDTSGAKNLSTKQWCEQENLLFAINGGMYAEDYKKHIGYMKTHGEIVSTHRNHYKSALAFNPNNDSLPDVYLHDLDETDLDWVIEGYDCVMQNLRLIKRKRENRWSPEKTRKWTEAALAEDSTGNMLFILCRLPMTMHEFNERIMALPLEIVAAQHLEGGVQTQMYVNFEEYTLGLSGGFDSLMENDTNGEFLFRIPHVIGIKKPVSK